MRKSFILSILAACGLLLNATLAYGWVGPTGPGPVHCHSTLSGTINANVVADPGCFLSGATINGNVQLNKGGSLTFNGDHPSIINGNLIANQCTGISVNSWSSVVRVATITNNVIIRRCTRSILIMAFNVSGNLDCSNNSAGCDIEESTIQGNVKVDNNSGSTAQIITTTVSGNTDFSGNNAHFNGLGKDTFSGNLSCQK